MRYWKISKESKYKTVILELDEDFDIVKLIKGAGFVLKTNSQFVDSHLLGQHFNSVPEWLLEFENNEMRTK